MIKRFAMMFFLISFCFMQTNALAFAPKDDSAKGVQNFLQVISEKARNVANKFSQVIENITNKIMGFAGEMIASVKGKIAAVKAGINKVKDVKQQVEDDIDKVKAEIDKVVNNPYLVGMKELDSLKSEKSKLKSQNQEEIAVREEAYQASLAFIDENINAITEEMNKEGLSEDEKSGMEDAILLASSEKNSLREAHEADVRSIESSIEDKMAEIDEKIKEKMVELGERGSGDFSDAADGKLKDNSDLIKAKRALFLIKKGDPETPEAISKVKKKRLKKLASQEVDRLYSNLLAIEKIEPRSDSADVVSEGVKSATYSGSINATNMIQKEGIDAKIDEVRAITLDLQSRANNYLNNLNVYSPSEKYSDTNKLDLRNYSFSENCVAEGKGEEK